jgi:hypothetical protein
MESKFKLPMLFEHLVEGYQNLLSVQIAGHLIVQTILDVANGRCLVTYVVCIDSCSGWQVLLRCSVGRLALDSVAKDELQEPHLLKYSENGLTLLLLKSGEKSNEFQDFVLIRLINATHDQAILRTYKVRLNRKPAVRHLSHFACALCNLGTISAPPQSSRPRFCQWRLGLAWYRLCPKEAGLGTTLVRLSIDGWGTEGCTSLRKEVLCLMKISAWSTHFDIESTGH